MALWVKTQNLLGNVRNMYGDSFPIEVRHFLAQWLEDKIWSAVDPAHPQYEQHAGVFLTELIQELESKAASMDSPDMFVNKIKLTEAAAIFKERYATCPESLFQLVQRCISTEFKLVQQMENAGKSGVSTEIAVEMTRLRQISLESGEDLRMMALDQEAFALHYHECTKSNTHLQQLQTQSQTQQTLELIQEVQEQKKQQEQKLNQMAASLRQMHLTLAGKLKTTVKDIEELQDRVIEVELMKWKRDQQLAMIGRLNSTCTTLDNIQEWCEHLGEIIWSNKLHIQELEQLQQKLGLDTPTVGNFLPDLRTKITALLSSLVTSTFIVERQPPQVMRTNTRFLSTVRLLIGGTLGVNITNPLVRVSIISEAQAQSLLKCDRTGKGKVSGEIINCTGQMQYEKATRHLSVVLRNMTLKKIKRTDKKGSESFMEEKFCLLFQSQFTVGGKEFVFQVWTLSLPVVVVVHGTQEPQAWATITWDNAFSEPGRVPFVVPEKVAWSAVAEALNMKFSSASGRQIGEPQLRCLAEKAFRDKKCSDYSGMTLSWSQFCKELLAKHRFTFWDWFYAVTRLTREHLRGPWSDGLIHGFLRKKEAEEMLSSCANGTFLLRFSDSELGGITIAWVVDGEVYMLQPFTSKDFAIRSLPDRIADLVHLTYLYPDKPKDEAFKKFYSPLECEQTSSNGYVKPILVTHVPGWGGPGYGMNTPQRNDTNTPQPIYPSCSTDSGSPRDTPSVNSQLSASVISFTGTKCALPDEDLPLIEKPFGDLTFNPVTWPQNQTFAGVSTTSILKCTKTILPASGVS